MPTGTQPLPSPLSQHIGRLLGEAVTERGLAQGHVAEASGMSPSQLSRAISGKKVFTLDQLDAICAVLGIDLVDLVAAADAATHGRPLPNRGELIVGRFGVGGPSEDLPAAARGRDEESGEDIDAP